MLKSNTIRFAPLCYTQIHKQRLWIWRLLTPFLPSSPSIQPNPPPYPGPRRARLVTPCARGGGAGVGQPALWYNPALTITHSESGRPRFHCLYYTICLACPPRSFSSPLLVRLFVYFCISLVMLFWSIYGWRWLVVMVFMGCSENDCFDWPGSHDFDDRVVVWKLIFSCFLWAKRGLSVVLSSNFIFIEKFRLFHFWVVYVRNSSSD